jgi:predicted nucleotidyltransferase component of viral defense system
MTLDTKWMPEATQAVFAHLRTEPLLQDFTLIGGTALALQIGHRLSQDLDFAFIGEKLPTGALRTVLANARAKGFTTQDMLSPAQLQQARINLAVDLHDWVQDWAISGVKVSFSTFEGWNEQMRAVLAYPRAAAQGTQFSVLGIEGLFAAKASLLARRVRSRDLFDLHTLLTRHGFSIRQLFDVIRRIDPTANPDIHRDVLRGLVPLDADDEGFQSVGVTTTVEALIKWFQAQINDYEVEQAKRIIEEVLQEAPSRRAMPK